MPPIPTDQLDAGDDSPKLARASLLLTVEAVNELFSILDPDTNTAVMAIARPIIVTGGIAAQDGTVRSSAIAGVYAGTDINGHVDVTLTDMTASANNRVTRLYTTTGGSVNLGFSSDDFTTVTPFLTAARLANATTSLTLASQQIFLTGQVIVSSGLSASTFTGDGSALTNLNGAALQSGIIPIIRLGTGTLSSSTFLRGDGTFAPTVSAVTVTAANGVSAVVANQGSTPALTFTLGAITPTSVAATGAISGTTFTGSGASLTNLNASAISSGLVPSANMGTGTMDTTTYLRGDRTWATAVTSVTIAAANGVTGTVATQGTTPALTIVLGAITPSSVAATGAISGSTLSGAGSAITALNASNISSGVVGTQYLGSGTASNTTFLRGDGTWQAVSGGGSSTATAVSATATVPTINVANSGVYEGTDVTTATIPRSYWVNSAAPAGDRIWGVSVDGTGAFSLSAFSDTQVVTSTPLSISVAGAITMSTPNSATAVPGAINLTAGTNTATTASQVGAAVNISAGSTNGSSGQAGTLTLLSGNTPSAAGATIALTGAGQLATTIPGRINITAGLGSNAAGGAVTISGGGYSGGASAGAGGVTIQGGTVTGASGPGGVITMTATAGAGNSVGGNIQISGGGAQGTGVAGSITLQAGNSNGAGNGGSIVLQTGSSSSGTSGGITLGVAGTARMFVVADTTVSIQPATDNTLSGGAASARFSTVYAGTGTINTSDETTKGPLQDLSDAETRVAIAAKKLLKKYQNLDAIALKGPTAARWHFGIGAQSLAAAFAAEGLDANAYGMFCQDTWYTVNGKPMDDNQVAYTATSAGAVLVTRYGVRYDELLVFIIAAL